MNKTVNINLGGLNFYIDEDAYQKLSSYFEAIKRSLLNFSGEDEIIKDIEMRVTELLSEMQKTEKHVIGLKEVDEVIAVMGQPEDYKIDDQDSNKKDSENKQNSIITKKLYRDKENGKLGGVLAGLGHYFGIEKVWLRVLCLILLFVFGTGVIAYLILWIVIPKATTTAEKLEMTGEPVTISTIEKKVRQEFDTVSEKLKNANYDQIGTKVKTGAERIGSSISEISLAILNFFSKFLGIILILFGLFILVSLFIGVFTLGTSSFIDVPWQDFINAGNYSDYPVWTFGLIMFFVIGIPFFFVALLGFKLVSPNLNSIGNIAKYCLLAIWLINVSIAIAIGIKQATAFAVDGRIVTKEELNIKPTDTLLIKFRYNEYFAENIDDTDQFKITLDSIGNSVIYSNNLSFKIAEGESDFPYIQIEKEAKGETLYEAKQRAEQIKYNYKINGNTLVFDNYLLTNLKEKYRNQEVEITLYLPNGTLIRLDESVNNYNETDSDYFICESFNENEVYKVEKDEIKCVNCFGEDINAVNIDTETTEDSTVTTTVTINRKEVIVNDNNTKKGLKIDKNGVIIKNN